MTRKSYAWACAVCGKTVYWVPHGKRDDVKRECPYKYCPFCGLKMEG